MVETYIIRDSERIRTYTGRVICRDGDTVVMVLSEPSSLADRSVRFSTGQIIESKLHPLPSQAVDGIGSAHV